MIADELDRADPDVRARRALDVPRPASPSTLPQTGEAKPAEGWRIVATWNGAPPRASAALLRRFALIEVSRPPTDELHARVAPGRERRPDGRRAAETLLRSPSSRRSARACSSTPPRTPRAQPPAPADDPRSPASVRPTSDELEDRLASRR